MPLEEAFESLETLYEKHRGKGHKVLFGEGWDAVARDNLTINVKRQMSGVLDAGNEVLNVISRDILERFADVREMDIVQGQLKKNVIFECKGGKHPKTLPPYVAIGIFDIERSLRDIANSPITPWNIRYLPPLRDIPDLEVADIIQDGNLACPYCGNEELSLLHTTNFFVNFERFDDSNFEFFTGSLDSRVKDYVKSITPFELFMLNLNRHTGVFDPSEMLERELSPDLIESLLDQVADNLIAVEYGTKVHSLIAKHFEIKHIGREDYEKVEDLLRIRFIMENPQDMHRFVRGKGLPYIKVDPKRIDRYDRDVRENGYRSIHAGSRLTAGIPKPVTGYFNDCSRVLDRLCMELQYRTLEWDVDAYTNSRQAQGAYKTKRDRMIESVLASNPELKIENQFLRRIGRCSEIARDRVYNP